MKALQKKAGRIWKRVKIPFIVVVAVFSAFVASQLLLYRYANPLLNGIITKVVKDRSDGLYRLKFDDLRIDMTNQSFHLKNLQLIPNKAMYWELRDKGEINTALYRIGIPRLDITGIDSYLLFRQQELHVEDILFSQPILKLVAKPGRSRDSSAVTYDAIHRDLYPVVSRLFKSVEIDRIAITDGYFDMHTSQADEDAKTRFDNMDITLFHFSLNSGNYRNRDRLFYADDIRIAVDEYALNLGDSVHSVSAEDITISTLKKQIRAKNIQLGPDQVPVDERSKLDDNLLDVTVPEVLVKGIDLPAAFFNQRIDIESAHLEYPFIRAYKQKLDTTITPDSVILRRSPKINLYELIKGKLHEVKLDTFVFNQALVSLYQNYNDKRPELVGKNISVKLGDFLVDSSAYYNEKQIFYARDIDLSLKEYTMYLGDSIHRLDAEELEISTAKNEILAGNVRLKPFQRNAGKNSIYRLRIPKLGIHGIDLAKAYNKQLYDIERLTIGAPLANISRYFQGKTKGDSIQRFTSDELYQLTSNYLKRLYINDIYLNSGRVRISNQLSDGSFLNTSGDLSFHLGAFMLSPNTVFRRDKPFNADDIRFKLTDYRSNIPNSSYRLFADTLYVSSVDSLVRVDQFVMKEDSAKTDSLAETAIKLSALGFTIQDADIPAIYFQNKFRAGYINLEKPDIRIKQNREPTEEEARKAKDSLQKDLTAFAGDTAIVYYRGMPERTDALVYTTLYDLRDTLLVADTLLQQVPGNITDTLFAELPAQEIPDTFLVTNKRIRFYEPHHYQQKGFDEVVLDIIGGAMKDFPVRSFAFDSLKVNYGHFAYDDSIIHDAPQQLIKLGFDVMLRDFHMKADRLFHQRKSPVFSKDYELLIRNLALRQPDMPFNLEMEQMALNEKRKSMHFNGVSLESKGNRDSWYRLDVPALHLKGFEPEKVYRNGEIRVDSLFIEQPKAHYKQNEEAYKTSDKQADTTSASFPELLEYIKLGHFKINKGETGLYRNDTTPQNRWFKAGITMELDSIGLHPQALASVDSFLAHRRGTIKLNDLRYKHSDKLHQVRLDSLHYMLDDSLLQGWELRIDHPGTMRYARKIQMLERAGGQMLATIHIPDYSLKNADIYRLLHRKEMAMHSLHLDSPDVKIYRFPFLRKQHPEKPEFGRNLPLPEQLDKLLLDSLRIPGADIQYTAYLPDTTQELGFKDLSLDVKGLSIDSASLDKKLLFSDDISMVLKDHTISLQDSFYNFHFDKLSLSTEKKQVTIHEPSLRPRDSRYKLGSQLKYQDGVFRLDGKALRLRNVDFPALLDEQKVKIGKTIVDSLNIFVYKDKRIPLDSSAVKPNMHDLFRLEQPYFFLDSVIMNNGYVLYEQSSPGTPQKARLDVTHLDVLGRKLTNDSAFRAANKKVHLEASMMLENKGKIKVRFTYPTGSAAGDYSFTGSLDTFDLRELNPVLEPMAFMRIRDGEVKNTRFYVEANDTIATGKVRVRYNDLKVAFIDKETGSTGRARDGLTSFVANTILRSNNPKWKWWPAKRGNIYYRREEALPVFNYWIQALLSGVKSTFGFESKELKKEMKRQKDEISQRQINELRDRLNVDPE